MTTQTTLHGTLDALERLPQSRYGNPRYLFTVAGQIIRTAPDSCHAYGLPNLLGRPVTVTVAPRYGYLTLLDITERVADV